MLVDDVKHNTQTYACQQYRMEVHNENAIIPAESVRNRTVYRLRPGHNRGNVVWFYAGARDIALLPTVQADPGAQQALYSMGTGRGSFLVGYGGRSVKPYRADIKARNVGITCRSQWPRGLRRRSATARLLRMWVRILPGAWTDVCCDCCVLSGRGLCDGLITRPEESYRLRCVVVCDLATSEMRRSWPTGRAVAQTTNM